MANVRVRTLEFLPEIFQTPTNLQFLGATLDQLVNPPITKRIEGYIGTKFGYGIDPNDYYVTEPTKTRTDYQLDPGIIFTKNNESVAKDFISYPGLIDALELEGGIVTNNNSLFESQFYSWDSFTNLDKIINFNQYYWLPEGPPVVTVSNGTVFSRNDYIVSDLDNTYDIRVLGSAAGSLNPTLTLLRGGIYRFLVNQNSSFWIQTLPGVSGYSPTQPNLYIRDVYGVSNNGEDVGIVEFTVPQEDAQNNFIFPGNNFVDVVSDLPYSDVNGKRLADLGGIDGVTSLNGLTVLFYNTGTLSNEGYVQEFYDENNYDINGNIVAPLTINITNTDVSGEITCDSTSELVVGQTITFTGTSFGGLDSYLGTGQIYYIASIVNSTKFTVTTQLGSGTVTLTTASGSLVGNINQGLYEEGYYTSTNEYFYQVTYVGDPNDPVLKLIPISIVPTNEKITARYGTEYISLNFYKNNLGVISLIPLITAPLDTLYYQDGTNPNKVGVIKLITSNITNTLNITTDILGKKKYTSPNGVQFTNGLKVSFDGDIIPKSYLQGEYYVEGVGTSIELIPVTDLFCPEPFTESYFIPYDTLPYDIGNYDSNLYIPALQDYITIARNSKSKNAWSRSNRWFHIDVISASANYNNNPEILNIFATQDNKAKRPVIEFYPNLALFESGFKGKPAVDFIDFRASDALSDVAGQTEYFPDVEVYTAYTCSLTGVTGVATTATVPNNAIQYGVFQVGQYITDTRLSNESATYPSVLPADAQIQSISVGTVNTTLTIGWGSTQTIPSITNVSFIANDQQNSAYALFDGARIIFAADNNLDVKNKIYVANLNITETSLLPVFTLTEAVNGQCEDKDQTVVIRGYNHEGETFYFNSLNWQLAQTKITVNQPPLFDIFDSNGISFGNPAVYQGTTFTGCTLFNYTYGSGPDDVVLGFPISYSSLDNVGDIQFTVSINLDTFDYVTGADPETKKVNTGYVYNIVDQPNLLYTRQLGWQTAIGPSVQYQLFSFDYNATVPAPNYKCDIAKANANEFAWPTILIYIDNTLLPSNTYTVTVGPNSTTIVINEVFETDKVIKVLLLSNQTSKTGYYETPINLNNNPLNEDLTFVNVGDIRSHYLTIYANNPNFTGPVFGANNYRDLGNLVPYGTKIIQNSAALVMPGTLLRQQNHNLFDSILFNSREYIKFKTLLIDIVNTTAFNQRFDPAFVLDDALDQISSSKSQSQAFFWSDMLPNKSAYITNTYTFNNDLDISRYPLSKIYDFSTANYSGVLVYLTRIVSGTPIVKQLIINTDYTVSTDSKSLTVNISLQPNDQITIKEYNQTYGSYVPNTPTKLGLYPAFIPGVVLDSDYTQPTYFIRGHDGSFNKLFGDYNTVLGTLVDFRDQALLEFETRIYNNLKLGSTVPISTYEVLPGYFRTTTLSYTEYLQIYSEGFLNWIGQNRLDFKKQFYNTNDQFTYNYSEAQNKLNNKPIEQGYWRGLYEYLYDTSTPNLTPWEMLHIPNKPSWWNTRYGPAPYTSDNLVLWEDLQAGINYNNGNPFVVENAKRPGLLNIIPVDNQGNLLSPFNSIVRDYDPNIWQRDWKVGDDGPVEFSYRRSSTWPFDLMRILALTKPAKFFNLGIDLDNYRYSSEFNQYLVNNRSHLVLDNIEIYGSGTAKTSFLNWVVDFEKQLGINATENITNLLKNLDVRLVYRLAGFSDKSLLKFYVEKDSPNSTNASLLIPDESYSVLLYNNQPYDKITYTSVVVQLVDGGYKVYGNSQNYAYFKILDPTFDGFYENINVVDASVKVLENYSNNEIIVPYGTKFFTLQEVSQFLASYGAWLESKGVIFDEVEFGIEINWLQMIKEFLYWAQVGWEDGSVITLNPSADIIKIDKESQIIQPLTLRQTNFILNQNLYPIESSDLSVVRDGTLFTAKPLNQGDSVAYGQFNVSNFEHGIVFDNVTLFNDILYNLVTGLRQLRITVKGTKTAEWNGTINASGFILNQDNILEWSKDVKYTKGQIVKYKNKYWISLEVNQPSNIFDELKWKRTDYDEIQKGLLPNSSTRSYESTLYYNTDKANLEKDSDLLSFSLIGYRPRDYLAIADLTDITQVNVYKNLIKNKGTRNAVEAFKGANLPQGGIDYEVYENWAVKSGEFGGVLNNNFVDFRINQSLNTGNPSIVALINGYSTGITSQEIPVYNLFNYNRPIQNVEILSTIPVDTLPKLFSDAGYVNFKDVRMSSYFFSGLSDAVDINGATVDISNFYVGEYAWVANYLEKWQVFSLQQAGQIISIAQNSPTLATITFSKPHNLTKLQPFAILNFNEEVDGYYFVSEVVSLTSVLINYTWDTLQGTVGGLGIFVTLNSHRVANSSEITNALLIDKEFVQNKLWVDDSDIGGWAVYRKTIDYFLTDEITKSNSIDFGNAVAYSEYFDYLFADSGLGTVFRYALDTFTKNYTVTQTLSGNNSFGSKIVHVNNFLFVTEPNSSFPSVYIYVRNNTSITDDIILCQVLPNPVAFTSWASDVAVSGDLNWIYVGDTTNNTVNVYQRQSIDVESTYLITGFTYIIKELGNTDWQSAGAVEAKIGIVFVATASILGTGIATQISYVLSTTISSFNLIQGDNFGSSIATNFDGSVVVVGAPNIDYSPTVDNYGNSFVYQRVIQNIEVPVNSTPNVSLIFELSYYPPVTSFVITATDSTFNSLVCSSTNGLVTNMPIIFEGDFGSSGLTPYQVYYVSNIIDSTSFAIKENYTSITNVVVLTDASVNFTGYAQINPVTVYTNGTLVPTNQYAVIGKNLYYNKTAIAGDIINVSGNNFILAQTLSSPNNNVVGLQFGTSVDIDNFGVNIVVGAPFDISSDNEEGAVYRYTNGGANYGYVIGTAPCLTTSQRNLLINGFLVSIPANSNAEDVSNTINSYQYNNIRASFTQDNKLSISLNDEKLALVNQKLLIGATDSATLVELGLPLYTQTQVIKCPHATGPTQFGKVVKFNTSTNSLAVSAPAGSRYLGTTFDLVDDDIINVGDKTTNEDTVFDNNATQFVDINPNAGAVYLFDYIGVYNESLTNPGAYIYGQSVNSKNQLYGYNPGYGLSLDFNKNIIVVGSPNYLPNDKNGQVTLFASATSASNWKIYRYSAPIPDINRIQNTQLFSADTNNTLINLDYIDPLQGKLLGAVAQNIDFITNADPAVYENSDILNTPANELLEQYSSLVWGADQVGRIWLNTSNIKFVNYHQNNENEYNAKYWGTVFPGSEVEVYTWVASNFAPSVYLDEQKGPGTPFDLARYTTQQVLNDKDTLSTVYYFWVRSTNTVGKKIGKTLSDSTLESYITSPKNSGISYLTPILPNTFALYNIGEYLNGNDTVLHVGFSTGVTDDPSHSEYTLIRANYPDDFLPGLPNPFLTPGSQANIQGNSPGTNERPESLYDRLIDSLSGVDETGAVVPDPWLPKAVQSGVLARPRQSFFYNRLTAVKNYLTYANEILLKYPIAEIRREATFLFSSGEFYNTPDYWEYINWWIEGYNNNTKSAFQVPVYADLSTLNVPTNTIVTVNQNGDGKFEVYRYDGNNIWTRIGLQNGTIQFKLYLWDYAAARLGFGDNFFDTTSFDVYPSEETKYIVRALNEQIYVNELVIHRNKSLILLFEYIESETIESQNYLPWLNKTSLVDVVHSIRELLPLEVFQSDNQVFLEGYVKEVKPYHVVIKEFIFKYEGTDINIVDPTDFDLPASFNTSLQKFISPELVLSNPSQENQYLPTNNIWQNPLYNQWYQNKGLSIKSRDLYNITILTSYLDLQTKSMYVDNAQGFPINGLILLGSELIAYSSVDRLNNRLLGLSRGYQNTEITNHIPGEQVIIDLPGVIVLNGGRGYVEPPKVTAYIDETIYGAPTRPAILQAVMNIDSVLSITVVDPGQGYLIQPEIIVEPSSQVFFSSVDVNVNLKTIKLSVPYLQTGDIVQYKKGANSQDIGGLKNNSWYYVNLLQSTPTFVIALYTSYNDAILDTNRVVFYNLGTGVNYSLNLGARVAGFVTASPTRENNVILRFDRTTYTSQIIEWEAGQYYGAYFAGNYFNSDQVSSSSIQLDSIAPPINTILASAQGVAFEISEVDNDRQIIWSPFIRYVECTIASNNSIRLIPYDDSVDENSSGSTIGFYVGMPIKFAGNMPNPIAIDTTYYVHSVINITDFTISQTQYGPQFIGFNNLTPVSPGAVAFTAQIIDTAILTVNYPGILNVTATITETNSLISPLNQIGTGGTNSFYTGLPVFFTGTTFGGVAENTTYYITSVLNVDSFTISTNPTPVSTTVTETTVSTVIVQTTNNFSLNDPIVFSGTTFGSLVAGYVYYVRQVVNATTLIISNSVNGPALVLTPATGQCTVTNQKDVLPLTSATGSMTMNVSLPVSPGQINGQQFTLYQTSGQYPNITSGTVSNLINRDCKATLDVVNKIAITEQSGGVDNFYVDMPIRFTSVPGGSGISSGTTYYVREFTGLEDPLNPGTYFPPLQTVITSSDSSFNNFICDSTNNLYAGMPIVFSGDNLGGVVISEEYFVRYFVTTAGFFVSGKLYTIETLGTTDFTLVGAASNTVGLSFIATGIGSGTGTAYGAQPMPNGTKFKISSSLGGSVKTLTTSNGDMTGTGDPYITLAASTGGSEVSLNYTDSDFNLVQFPSSSDPSPVNPSFDVSYILGGYRVIISNGGTGFAVTNTITITGNLIGGTTPLNNLTMTVNTISSTGAIIDVICSGQPSGQENQYYLKVVSPNQLAVYSDPLMQVPVSGLGFNYVGFTTTTATEIIAASDRVIVNDSSLFNLNDPIIFTGTLFTTELIQGQTYYVYDKPTSTSIRLTLDPGGSLLTFSTNASGTMTAAKPGSFAFLPEPFYFNQSIVKYNNRVWICIISNNDTEFILGKWELIDSDDRRLNAMDRVIGYYDPTVNMPGVDLTQLFTGVTYPNPTYLGNPFGNGFSLDTILQGDTFYPNDVDIYGIVFNSGKYLLASNLTNSSAILGSTTGTNWAIAELANVPIGLTDIIYANGFYIVTSTNSATPICVSTDGIVWSTNLFLNPDLTPLISVAYSFNAVTYHNGKYIVVGKNIVTSDNAYIWTQRFNFTNSNNTLYDVTYAQLTVGSSIVFDGYIAVGQGTNTNLLLTSNDAITWTQQTSFATTGLYGIASNGSVAVAVGQNGFIYNSIDGVNWSGINVTQVVSVNGATNVLNINSISTLAVNDVIRFTNSFDVVLANTTYYVQAVISSSQIRITDGIGNPAIVLTGASSIPNNTFLFKYPTLAQLNNVVYENSLFVAVGNDGRIATSVNGSTWTERVSGVSSNLQNVTYVASTTTWTVVGENNAIIKSVDNCVTWQNASTITVAPNVYDVQGAEFAYGYGPEELVPGNITDNLMMIVNTRPGTNWPVTTYAHAGYDVVSYEFTPDSGTQLTYSWAGNVLVPAQLAVFVINGSTNLSTSLYRTIDYSINWIEQTITLNTPLAFTPVADKLRIDVYEVGNGDQLVKSNTKIDPIRTNALTGWSEIYLNCNYSAVISNGSGVIRPGTFAVEVNATQTFATTNTILVASTVNFVLNTPIKFAGTVFGNIVEDTTYYVKSINVADSTITISASYNGITGIAGPTFVLTNGSGLMAVVIKSGTGLIWTEPVVEHNGNKLVLGKTNNVVRTKSSDNSITTNSTGGLIVNTPIIFSDSIFGGVITPQTTYYIKSIIDNNEFTISATLGGSELVLTDATGGASFITNDYAFAEIQNSTQAKIVFSTTHNNVSDYIVYSVFGETQPLQYGYTIPETETFIGDGSTSLFNLDNYIGDDNVENAIVEVGGLRQTSATYTLDFTTNTLTFNSPPAANTSVSVTSYNNTDRQYLKTQYGISSNLGAAFITLVVESTNNNEVPYDGTMVDAGSFSIGQTYSIAYLNDNGSPPGADTDFGLIGAVSVNAGSLVDGETYIIYSVGTTDFTLAGAPSNTVGTKFTADFVGADPTSGTGTVYEVEFTATGAGAGTGSAVLEGYGYDSTIVTAGDFIIGQSYTIKTVGTTDFTLIGAASNTVGVIFTATGYGTGTGTAFGPGFFDETLNWLTLAPGYTTAELNINDPIIFDSPTLDGIVAGITYYIVEIWNTQDFVISTEISGDPLTLTDDTGSMTCSINSFAVADIININNAISTPLAIDNTTDTVQTLGVVAGSFVVGKSYVIDTIGTTDFTLIGAASNTVGVSFTATGIGSGTGTADLYELIVDDSTNFVIGQTIMFKGTSIGGLNTTGTVYFVYGIIEIASVHYVTIADEFGNIIVVTTDTGNLQTIVGGVPAVRVTTNIPHKLYTNNLVRIDGTNGSIQLNGNTYYVHKISSYIVDLYSQPYTAALGESNYPITSVSSYTGGGYIWLDNLFTISTTNAYSADSTTDLLNVQSIEKLVVDTPIYFTPNKVIDATNLITGQQYSIRTVGTTDFTLVGASSNDDGIVFTATGTGTGTGTGTVYALGEIEIFGNSGILPETTYYVKELYSTVVDAGNFVVGSSYTISFIGTTDFTLIGAVSNTLGVSFIATGVGSGTGKATYYGIKISETRGGSTFALTTSNGIATVSQWDQYNVDRLWVTINGYRVPSSSLKLYGYNNLGILSVVESGDEVIITSMIPSSTPDQEVYILNVNQDNQPSVYRANTLTRTWLTQPIGIFDTSIFVNDIHDITDTVQQTVTTPIVTLSDNKYRIGLTADKDYIINISVYNNNPARLGVIASSNYELVIEDLSPVILITPGSYISTGDVLTITTIEGKIVVINGEQVKFTEIDTANNSISGLQRGFNNTGIQTYIAKYTEVYGLLPNNRLSDVDYNKNWNSNVYNTVEGDPLQISVTESAEFLYTDVT